MVPPLPGKPMIVAVKDVCVALLEDEPAQRVWASNDLLDSINDDLVRIPAIDADALAQYLLRDKLLRHISFFFDYEDELILLNAGKYVKPTTTDFLSGRSSVPIGDRIEVF